jgi:hypothetical protein
MKMKREEIKNFVYVIIFFASVLSMLGGTILFISSDIIKEYYYIDKSEISHYNGVLYKLKTELQEIYDTKDSLETSIYHLLNYQEIKKYGDFVKMAIKEINDTTFYLKRNVDSISLNPSIRKILMQYFDQPFYSKHSLAKEILSRFSDQNLPEIHKKFYDLFSGSITRYSYLDTVNIKSISLIAADSILSLNNKKYVDRDELIFNLHQTLPKNYFTYYAQFFNNSITQGSPTGTYFSKLSPWLFFPGLLVFIIFIIIAKIEEDNKKKNTTDKITEKELEEAKEQIKNEPNKIKPSWDIAYLTLQQYFEKNLQHINSIYKISINVMIVGFIIIGLGIFISYFGKDKDISIISISSGILIEFIGATFLIIFKSTIKQALKYTKTLEKINNVGMSMKILDTIESSDLEKGELLKAKIEISKLLIENSKPNQADTYKISKV